ncbi:MAG: hypothetical protein P1P64_03735 [Treponemataceae bacterium]
MKNFKKLEITNASLDKLIKPFSDFDERWALLASGNGLARKDWNAMTVSWGSSGILWNKQIAIVYVRPFRFTHEFTEKNAVLSLSFFPDNEASKKILQFCGTKSGRDFDKARETGLKPLLLPENTIAFEQAETTLVCKKLYRGNIKPENFLDSSIAEKNYPNRDFHTVYICEIISAYVKG